MSTKAENLSRWLNTRKPDYNTGMALLLSYTNKPALYAQLSEYKDVTMLRKVLSGLVGEAKVKMPVASRVAEQQSSPVPIKIGTPPQEGDKQQIQTAAPRDKVLQQLHAEWVDLLKQIEDLKQKLFFIGRDAGTGKPKAKMSADEKEQRKEIARLLVGKGGLNEQCLKNRDAKDYYEKFGKLPEREKKDVVLSEAEGERKVEGDVYLLKENVRKNIAKLKGKLKKEPNHKSAPEWNMKLQKMEEDLKLYQSKLNGGK